MGGRGQTVIRILVVDDEPLTRLFLAQKIPSLNENCIIAGCADDGLKALDFLCTNETVDLVITDIKMPVMDGLELSQKIHARFPDMLVVILSGFGDFDFAQQAIQNGVSEYLLKPIVNLELAQLLSNMAVRIETVRQKKLEQERTKNLLMDASNWIVSQYCQSVLLEQPEEAEASLDMLNTLDVKMDESMILCIVSFVPVGLERMVLEDSIPSVVGKMKDVADKLAHNGRGWKFEDIIGNLVILLPGIDHLPSGLLLELTQNCGGEVRVASNQVTGVKNIHMAWQRAKTVLLKPGTEVYVSASIEEDLRLLGELEQTAQDFSIDTRENWDSLLNRFYSFCCDIYGDDISSIQVGALLVMILKGPDTAMMEKLSQLDGAPAVEFSTRMAVLFPNLLKTSVMESTEDENVDIVDAAKAYIQQNFHDTISLSMVADVVGVSAGYLSNLFHKKTGEPYVKYLTRVRMAAAARYLDEHPRMLISAIAEKTGYIATKHFLYVFKKHFGSTPSEYRQSKNDKSFFG